GWIFLRLVAPELEIARTIPGKNVLWLLVLQCVWRPLVAHVPVELASFVLGRQKTAHRQCIAAWIRQCPRSYRVIAARGQGDCRKSRGRRQCPFVLVNGPLDSAHFWQYRAAFLL